MGAKGVYDLVAWDAKSIRCISIKSGTKYASSIEREALQLLPRPASSTVEIWRLPTGSREPLIERL